MGSDFGSIEIIARKGSENSNSLAILHGITFGFLGKCMLFNVP
jgi:hypothetical protein